MGDKVNRNNGEPIRPVITEVGTDTGNGASGGSTSTTNARTTETERGGSGGTGGTNSKGKTEEKEQLSGLALLTEDERKAYETADEDEKRRLLRNAKKRERYRKNKEQAGQPVKPRKVRGKKKDEPQLDTTQLNAIVASLSAVVASRPNCEHWLLSEKEIESITTPLSKMLAESETFAGMGQYSNQIALCIACITVFMPRVVMSVQKNKEVKKLARTGQRTKTNVNDERLGDIGKEKTGNNETDRGDAKQSTANGTDDVDLLSVYGLPISG